jgi:hypothetical protein
MKRIEDDKISTGENARAVLLHTSLLSRLEPEREPEVIQRRTKESF